MAKSKAPTPQEIYKQRKRREELERTAYLPPGLINHGNTCFMNSVLQGLIATRLLSDLVHFKPISDDIQSTAPTPILPQRSPQLTNGHNIAGKYEQPWVNMMPIGDVFLTIMYKAWDMQDARRRDYLSPKNVLSTLGQKYDQYLDFAQQDAHEFLRILLDAMRMEEQDVIKKRQPPLPPAPKKRRRTTITPGMASNSTQAGPSSGGHSDNPADPSSDISAEPSLLSFADLIFGGQLTSILVCQKCKHISQTYEDFNDISLSIKPEDYITQRNGGKRERFKRMVGKLGFGAAAGATPVIGISGISAAAALLKANPPQQPSTSPTATDVASPNTPEQQPNSDIPKPPELPSSTSDVLPTEAPTNVSIEDSEITVSPQPRPSKPLSIPYLQAFDIQRSSSVPPSPSTVERAAKDLDGIEVQLLSGVGAASLAHRRRRRSLDLTDVPVGALSTSSVGVHLESSDTETGPSPAGSMQGSGPDVAVVDKDYDDETPKPKEDETPTLESQDLDSDSSHIIVNVTGPDEKHVEFIEPIEKLKKESTFDSAKSITIGKEKEKEKREKEKDKDEGMMSSAGWVKLGRRISMTVGGLGRSKDKDKEKKDEKEREKKSRSMERNPRTFLTSVGSIKEDADVETASVSTVAGVSIQNSASAGPGTSSTTQIPPSDAGRTRMASAEASLGANTKDKLADSKVQTSNSVQPDGSVDSKPLPSPPNQSSAAVPPITISAPRPQRGLSWSIGASAESFGTSAQSPPAISTASISSPSQPSVTETASISAASNATSTTAATTAATQPSSTSLPIPRFPNVSVQRSKSPKPPKPSAAETEYLRKILADISSSSSTGNPFSIFKPPLLGGHAASGGTGVENTTRASGSHGASSVWLGMGHHFSGLEECLRLFTAVEVLDGENMVGCRRCWKIQNGVLGSGKKKDKDDEDSDAEEEKEGDDDREEEDTKVEAIPAPQSTNPSANGPTPSKLPSRPSLKPLISAPAIVHIPTSMSSPTVGYYTPETLSHSYSYSDNPSDKSAVDRRSISSLPTVSISESESNYSQNTDGERYESDNLTDHSPSSDSLSGSRASSVGPESRAPIPVISTTDTDAGNREHSVQSQRESAYAKLVGTVKLSTNSDSGKALTANSTPAGSRDSLLVPGRSINGSGADRRKSGSDLTNYSRAATTGPSTDEYSTEDESDTSIDTSISADSSRGDVKAPVQRLPGRRATMPQQPLASSAPPMPSTPQQARISAPPPVTASASQEPQKAPVVSALVKKSSKPKPTIMRPAFKRYLIATPPPVLVVHLKRFQQTSRTAFSFSHGFKKLDDYVSFPEYLDLSPFLAPKKEDYGLGKKKLKERAKDKEKAKDEKYKKCMYRLYAVVVHIGNMLGGHYIAYTALPNEPSNRGSGTPTTTVPHEKLSSPDGSPKMTDDKSGATSTQQPKERQWAYISDTVVRLTTLEEVLHAKAYMCWYERC
ncbi:hypothetical protein BJ165DRAFT_1487950 [Panaeolus papilionaceus]|nr:hypothetical protein BJ165DRAFT_1487950 [Panaeolus papilionaceus]